jgi:opacity protein-like surface antigen
MKTKFILIVAAVAISMFACSDDNETTGARLNLDFNTVTTADNTSQRTLANGLEFTDGIITLSEIRFEAEADVDSLEIEFELEQQTVLDFATGTTNPDISGISIPAGTYEEVEIEIELFDESDEPGVVLNGTFTYNGEAHPVRFEFNSGETFEVEMEGNVVLSDGTNALAQITLDPHVWFASVTANQLAAAERDANGVIVISESVNSDIFEIAADGLDLATDVEFEM